MSDDFSNRDTSGSIPPPPPGTPPPALPREAEPEPEPPAPDPPAAEPEPPAYEPPPAPPEPEPEPEPAAPGPPTGPTISFEQAEPEPGPAFEQSAPQPPPAPAAPAASDADTQMVADMLRGYAEDVTSLSARLDRFGSNAPVASDVARDQATALSRIASELLAAAEELG
jgi:hypothetical protein